MKLILREVAWKDSDRSDYMDICRQLYTHKKNIKGLGKEKQLATQNKIKQLRSSRQEFGMKFFGAKLIVGKHILQEGWKEDNSSVSKSLSKKLQELFSDIRERRQESKFVRVIKKELLGYRYQTIGNVFTKPGQIKSLVGTVSDDEKMATPKKPLSFKKENYVGVEIELITKCSKEYLIDLFIDNNLQSYVQIKSDSSIECEDDYERGYEIVLMADENNIFDIVNKVCKVLKAKRVSAKANNTCGLHVHLDMRNRNVSDEYKKLYYSQSVLLGMLPISRREGDWHKRFCKKNETSNYEEQAKHERYYVINTTAYKKYRTLEIRAHSGTVNPEKINNWIAILIGIVNCSSIPEHHLKKNINSFCNFFNIKDNLKTYIEKRTKKFQDKKIDTIKDESEAA